MNLDEFRDEAVDRVFSALGRCQVLVSSGANFIVWPDYCVGVFYQMPGLWPGLFLSKLAIDFKSHNSDELIIAARLTGECAFADPAFRLRIIAITQPFSPIRNNPGRRPISID